jgi:PadR family transcriptional regulator, regulatory protein PadR
MGNPKRYNSFELSNKEEIIMLTMLHKQRYGIEIIDMVWHMSDGNIDINFGSLYPALQKLSKRGFIQETEPPEIPSEDLHDRCGHRRKYYLLTEYGHMALGQIFQVRTSLRNIQGQWRPCI